MLSLEQATAGPVYVGSAIKIEFQTRVEGEPLEPTLITVTIRAPVSKSETVLTKSALTIDDVGEFSAAFIADEPGPWKVRVACVGVVDQVKVAEINVTSSEFD